MTIKTFFSILCIVKWYFFEFFTMVHFFRLHLLKSWLFEWVGGEAFKIVRVCLPKQFSICWYDASIFNAFSRQCTSCFIHFKFFWKWKCCNFGFLEFVVYIFDNVQDSLPLICRWRRRGKNIRKCLIQSLVFPVDGIKLKI